MKQIILGTDWWTDCDDAVALRLVCNAVKKGEIVLKAIGINACMDLSVSSLVSFLHLDGVYGIPVGIDREAVDFSGNPPYQARLAGRCDIEISNDDVPDAVSLYIETLKNTDGKLEIIEIGYPQVIAGVIEKEPELFAEKVSKVWMMAGKWDENPGRENNFSRSKRASKGAYSFCKNCPVPVTFLGFEVGESVKVGGKLPQDDHLKDVLIDHGSGNGRSAWDPMLVAVALNENIRDCGYDEVRGKAQVNPETGENTFTKDVNGQHCFLVKRFEDSYYADRIEDLSVKF